MAFSRLIAMIVSSGMINQGISEFGYGVNPFFMGNPVSKNYHEGIVEFSFKPSVY
jgi:hypothetical protein